MKYLLIIFVIFICSCATAGHDKTEVRKLPTGIEVHITPDSIKFIETQKKSAEDTDLLFDMANKYFDAGRYSESGELYAKIIDESPMGPLAGVCYYNLGLIKIKQLEWEKAASSFINAFNVLQNISDKTDSYINYLESLKKAGKWDVVLSDTEKALNSYFPLKIDEKVMTEISIRMAEALVMTGKIDEGRNLARYWQLEIRKKYPRYEAVYIPELAYAHFVAAMSFVYEFGLVKLDDTVDTLTEKCRKIIEAQKEFIKSINVGVVFWSNASAFEISKMYMDLYSEMENYKIPEDLSGEERDVYSCELWNKTRNLLNKSRKALLKSIDIARKVREENEYLEKSAAMVLKIDEIYNSKELSCAKYREAGK